MKSLRIALICFNDLALCQYLYKYTAVFDNVGIAYDVIYWNRSGRAIDDLGFEGTPVAYGVELDTYQPFARKISAFLGFRRFALSQIKQRRYDRLFILTSQTAVALSSLLLSQYRGRYVYDFRDITLEFKVPLFKKLITRLLDEATLVCFSSPGFMDAFGLKESERIVLAHNSQYGQDHEPKRPGKSRPIRLSYWGMVRQVPFFESVCSAFANDNRFLLSFHGEGRTDKLAEFCSANEIENVSFGGRYDYLKDIAGLVEQADIINCLYDNDSVTQPTLAVKLYDSLRFGIPILVSKGSCLAGYLGDASFSLPVDINADNEVGDQLYAWYSALDYEALCRDFEKYRTMVARDDARFEEAVLRVAGER